ncbi:MAG: discoidin domain-containing protein [Sphaerochaetaceae bacterium]|nr:discoidin domain-containing protein [Sphaerochaetaceae bacterium]
MSKAEGKRIGVKFTEDLVGDVSGKLEIIAYKFYRWHITSTWSGSRLYLYELEMYGNDIKVDASEIISMSRSSAYSSSYDVNRLFDGIVPGTEWDANGSLPHWVKIELSNPKAVNKFKWHTGTSDNKPKQFQFQGSDDGENWTNLYEGESPNTNYWIEFNTTPPGNEGAFRVTGQEYQYVNGPNDNGPVLDKTYSVGSVETHPTVDKAILLTMMTLEEFDSVLGNLTVAYDATKGNLSGRGGRVESFSAEFLPADLVSTPDVGLTEKLSIAPTDITSDLKRVAYIDAYDDKDKITVAPGAITVSLLEAAIINP